MTAKTSTPSYYWEYRVTLTCNGVRKSQTFKEPEACRKWVSDLPRGTVFEKVESRIVGYWEDLTQAFAEEEVKS